MKYIMRQSRDGAVELVDRSPTPAKDHDLMSAISRVGWETTLIWYMRTLAWVWMAKGLFHWAIILGALPALGQFTTMALPLQATIVAFACLDLLAAIGLWLAAAWGAVVWLTSTVSMAVVELFFPKVYGSNMVIVLTEMGLLAAYLLLAVLSARERPV